MPREDYEKFIKSFDSENYGVMSCWTNKKYYLPWAKIYDKRTIKIEDAFEPKGYEIGFNIDVFPCDKIESQNAFHEMKHKYRRIVKKHQYSQMKKQKGLSPKNILRNLVISFYNNKGNKFSRIIDSSTKNILMINHLICTGTSIYLW